MYAIPNASRVYITSFFLLCAAFLLAPSLAVANDGYWSTAERRFISQNEVNARTQRLFDQLNKPSGTTISNPPSAPSISKNAAGGLSATTNNVLKTLDQPSNFSSTANYSAASAKNALKSCLRSPACAGRALGAGAVIYEGIKAWNDVYDILLNDDGVPSKRDTVQVGSTRPDGATCFSGNTQKFYYSCEAAMSEASGGINEETTVKPNSDSLWTLYIVRGSQEIPVFQAHLIQGVSCPPDAFLSYTGCNGIELVEVSEQTLDSYIDEDYSPQPSDAPLVLLSDSFNSPQSIILSNPEPAQLPSTTTISTDSQGKTTTSITDKVITYNILNNNSPSPSIESSVTETTTTYDDTANMIGTSTSTTTHNPIPSEAPSSGASADIELPAFCTWASIVCEWIGWTKEGIEGEEPDLINLISEFEPDEQQYNSGIGSGSCPAPMSLNLGIINRSVDVSYQPFCDFLDMIRPLVIAGAWLLSAFMYVGVLRRG